jgi:nitroreductase/dihydropteridine reductase
MDSGFLSRLQWRHATKAFDETKPVTPEQLNKILEAIRWAPTSFGVQPFYVKVVRSPVVKQKMQTAGWNQRQWSQSTAVLVFVADTNVPQRFEKQLELRSAGDPAAREKLKMYETAVKGWMNNQKPEIFKEWAQRQIYLALGFALAACAELEVDSCPMEGFSPEEFDRILTLPNGHYSTVALTIGTRHPTSPVLPKWRFPTDHFFEFVD